MSVWNPDQRQAPPPPPAKVGKNQKTFSPGTTEYAGSGGGTYAAGQKIVYRDGKMYIQTADGSLYQQTGIKNGQGIWTKVSGSGPRTTIPIIPNVPGGGGFGSGGFGAAPTYLTTISGQKLTKAQFDAWAVQLQHQALQFGKKMSSDMVKQAIMQDISVPEMTDRLQAVHLANRNKDYLNDLIASANANGFKVNKQDILKGLVGAKPASFYSALQQFDFRVAARQTGIDVVPSKEQKTAGDLALSTKTLESVLGNQPYEFDLKGARKIESQYAALAIQYLPESRLRGFDITKKALYKTAAGQGSHLTDQQLQALDATLSNDYKVHAGGAFAGQATTPLRNNPY